MAHGDITHIDIPVTDLARSTTFYAGLFGWRIAEAPGFEGYPMWQAPNEISGGGLAPRDEGFTQPRSYVEVDSIDETLAKATANGGTVLTGQAADQRDQLVGCPGGPGWEPHRPLRGAHRHPGVMNQERPMRSCSRPS